MEIYPTDMITGDWHRPWTGWHGQRARVLCKANRERVFAKNAIGTAIDRLLSVPFPPKFCPNSASSSAQQTPARLYPIRIPRWWERSQHDYKRIAAALIGGRERTMTNILHTGQNWRICSHRLPAQGHVTFDNPADETSLRRSDPVQIETDRRRQNRHRLQTCERTGAYGPNLVQSCVSLRSECISISLLALLGRHRGGSVLLIQESSSPNVCASEDLARRCL